MTFDERFFNAAGERGALWSIDGKGFGEAPGTVTMGGISLPIVEWTDAHISGVWPGDREIGPLVVTSANGHQWTGHFNV